jgi:hypothetical protein
MISVLGAEKLSLVEIEAFLASSESVRFVGCGRTEIYGWVERLLCHHEYPLQGRRSKGPLRAYVECMTGLSRAQSTRLIGSYVRIGRVAVKPSGRPRYQRHYTPADIELLAAVDEAHERLSGPATRHIPSRSWLQDLLSRFQQERQKWLHGNETGFVFVKPHGNHINWPVSVQFIRHTVMRATEEALQLRLTPELLRKTRLALIIKDGGRDHLQFMGVRFGYAYEMTKATEVIIDPAMPRKTRSTARQRVQGIEPSSTPSGE